MVFSPKRQGPDSRESSRAFPFSFLPATSQALFDLFFGKGFAAFRALV